jgi:hypothetical protein
MHYPHFFIAVAVLAVVRWRQVLIPAIRAWLRIQEQAPGVVVVHPHALLGFPQAFSGVSAVILA